MPRRIFIVIPICTNIERCYTIPKWVFRKAKSKLSNICSFFGTTLPTANLLMHVFALGKQDGRLSLNAREGGIA